MMIASPAGKAAGGAAAAGGQPQDDGDEGLGGEGLGAEGYSAAYARLANAARPQRTVLGEIKDNNQLLALLPPR